MKPSAPITHDLLTIPRTLPSGPVNLIGMSRAVMLEKLLEIGTPEKQVKMRAAQLWQWIYQKGERNFSQMSNLSKNYRELLSENFILDVPKVISKQCSKDGTRKYLLQLAGGHEVEAVYIPEEGRGTLCVSSQVGCTLTCSFCHTGTQKLVRNLTPGEIVGQVLIARDDLGEWKNLNGTNNETRLLSNVVLMGMGEPCLLYTSPSPRDATLSRMPSSA